RRRPGGEVAGEHHQPEGGEGHPAGDVDRLEPPPEAPEQLHEPETGEAERHADAHDVGDEPPDPSRDGVLGGGSGEHHREYRSDAGGPPEGERHPHHRRRPSPQAGGTDVEAALPLQEAERSPVGDRHRHDEDAHHHDHHSGDRGQFGQVAPDHLGQRGGRRSEGSEHDREPGDEQADPGEHPPRRHRPGAHIGGRVTRHHGQVAGKERQDTRRHERAHPPAESHYRLEKEPGFRQTLCHGTSVPRKPRNSASPTLRRSMRAPAVLRPFLPTVPLRADDKWMIFLLWVTGVAMGWAQVEPSSLVPFTRIDLGVSQGGMSLILSIARFAAFFAVFVGALADRIGRRRPLIGSLALLLTATGLSALAPTPVLYGAAQALARVGAAATAALAVVAMAEGVSPPVRAYSISFFGAAASLGSGISVMTLPLAESVSWRLPHGLPAVFLVVLPFLWRRLPES